MTDVRGAKWVGDGRVTGAAAHLSGVTRVPSRPVVVTVVHGRHDRLDLQQRALAAAGAPVRVVVAMGDHDAARIAARTGAHVVEIDAPGPLPLAAARNAGAAAALDLGADVLVFLDVDCLPAPGLLDGYVAAARSNPDALLCGPVTYLPPLDLPAVEASDPEVGFAALAALLADHRRPHPARPDPAPGRVEAGDAYKLFWSLSFAVRPDVWARLGGFCEEYTGYGGEDTDLAFIARAAGVPLRWVGGADAYHRHHPVSRPPVEHVDDILRNGATFARRWGAWPMTGWLEEFEALGLVRRDGDGWARVTGRGSGVAAGLDSRAEGVDGVPSAASASASPGADGGARAGAGTGAGVDVSAGAGAGAGAGVDASSRVCAARGARYLAEGPGRAG